MLSCGEVHYPEMKEAEGDISEPKLLFSDFVAKHNHRWKSAKTSSEQAQKKQSLFGNTPLGSFRQ